MARPAARDLTDRELEVLHVFWRYREATASEARDHLVRVGRHPAAEFSSVSPGWKLRQTALHESPIRASFSSPNLPTFRLGSRTILTPSETPFLEELDKQTGIAERALADRDVDAAVASILAIDTQMHDWAADTFDSDEQDPLWTELT